MPLTAPPNTILPDRPLAVIGDVHGHADALLRLRDKLATSPGYKGRTIVFVGDLIDRGPDPYNVVLDVMDWKKSHYAAGVYAVMGNHELAMLSACGLVPSAPAMDWLKRYSHSYSCQTTLASFAGGMGLTFAKCATVEERIQVLGQELGGMPVGDFLAGMPWVLEHPAYLIVHAGLVQEKPFAHQLKLLRERNFVAYNKPAWICDRGIPFAQPPKGCTKTVVSGHVQVQKVSRFGKRILVDTSGGYGFGHLSAILLPENEVISVPVNPSHHKPSRRLFDPL